MAPMLKTLLTILILPTRWPPMWRLTRLGILICGSGNGVAMAANKHADIRAALCWTEDLAKLAREHNNANIICIPARFVSTELTISMIDAFLNTAFEGGRHANRVNKIAC